LSQLITAEYPLADINRAFDDLEAGRVARALVAI
jgi:Zn-dependent alcohol dehydrogenase